MGEAPAPLSVNEALAQGYSMAQITAHMAELTAPVVRPGSKGKAHPSKASKFSSSSSGKKALSADELFKLLDTNGDGVLTKNEVVENCAKLRLTAKEAAALFLRLDADGSGSLTKEEAVPYLEAVVVEAAIVPKSQREAAANPFTQEARDAREGMDRARAWPWSLYVDSEADRAAKTTKPRIDAPNFGCSGGLGRDVIVWDLDEHEPRFTKLGKRSIRFTKNEILAMDVTSNPASGVPLAVTAGWDQEVKIWDLDEGKCVQLLEHVHSDKITGVNFLYKGPSSAPEDGAAAAAAAAAAARGEVVVEEGGGAGAAASAPTGLPPWSDKNPSPLPWAVATSSADGTVVVTALSAARTVCSVAAHDAKGGGANCLAVAPDGRLAATGGCRDQSVRVWDLERGAAVATFEGHTGFVTAVCVTEEGRRILSSSNDGTLRLWDLVSGGCAAVLRGHAKPVLCCAVTPDGARAVSGSEDKSLRLWDLRGVSTGSAAAAGAASPLSSPPPASPPCAGAFAGHTHWVASVDLSPDGLHAISGGHDGNVRLWDIPTSGAAASVALVGHRGAVNACRMFRWREAKPKLSEFGSMA